MKKKIILTVLALNYNACLIAGIIGIMLYAAGVNKCKKAGSISLIIYLLVNLIGKCLLWWISINIKLKVWNLVSIYQFKRMNTQ